MRTATRSTKDEEISFDWDPTKIPARCWHCNTRHTILVRVLDSGQMSRNRIGVCENPACQRFTDVRRIGMWVRESMVKF